MKSSDRRGNPVDEENMPDARVETIINYYDLGGGLVSAGQPTPEEFVAIRDAGYELIINLVPVDAGMALANEREIVQSLGLEYVHIPVVWDSPQLSDVETFFKTLQANPGKKIFLHCEVNYRASSFLYLYRRMVLGVDEKQARQDLQWIWAPNPTWTKFIAGISGSGQ
jgi:protein tyrosine phosphatase (PTP) superfamily phosphohydrolase (DUF442 family)